MPFPAPEVLREDELYIKSMKIAENAWKRILDWEAN